MYVVRRAGVEGLKEIHDLALSMSVGVTSLPKEREVLKKKLSGYFFVLEEEGEIIGCCQILPEVEGTWLFSLEASELLPTPVASGLTEICGLFLHPEKRRGSLGKLLSWSRFLFIAEHPDLFNTRLLAQMRGVINEEGHSPFWSAYGEKVTGLSFEEALEQYTRTHAPPENLPKNPVPLTTFSKEVRAILGGTHKNTRPAAIMLQQMGFSPSGLIDPIDAGPTLIAQSSEVLKSRTLPLLSYGEGEVDALLCSGFRAIQTPITLQSNGLITSKDAAKTLQVHPGDSLRFILI